MIAVAAAVRYQLALIYDLVRTYTIKGAGTMRLKSTRHLISNVRYTHVETGPV